MKELLQQDPPEEHIRGLQQDMIGLAEAARPSFEKRCQQLGYDASRFTDGQYKGQFRDLTLEIAWGWYALAWSESRNGYIPGVQFVSESTGLQVSKRSDIREVRAVVVNGEKFEVASESRPALEQEPSAYLIHSKGDQPIASLLPAHRQFSPSTIKEFDIKSEPLYRKAES